MNIKELVNNNIEKIELFIIILEHLNNEFNNKLNVNIHKVISSDEIELIHKEYQVIIKKIK